MDYDRLIERLRTESLYADKASLEIMDLCMEAATALSTLQTENEKLLDENRRWSEATRTLSCAIENLRDELEQVKRERDVVVSDLETVMAYGNFDACQLCKNGQCYIRGGTKPCLPKWRGQKEE